MAKVRITFSADLKQVGKIRTVTDEEAVVLVREGRAVHVAEPPPEPEPETESMVKPATPGLAAGRN